MLESDIDKNDEKIDETAREMNRISETIQRRIEKNREHQEFSVRVVDLKNLINLD